MSKEGDGQYSGTANVELEENIFMLGKVQWKLNDLRTSENNTEILSLLQQLAHSRANVFNFVIIPQIL